MDVGLKFIAEKYDISLDEVTKLYNQYLQYSKPVYIDDDISESTRLSAMGKSILKQTKKTEIIRKVVPPEYRTSTIDSNQPTIQDKKFIDYVIIAIKTNNHNYDIQNIPKKLVFPTKCIKCNLPVECINNKNNLLVKCTNDHSSNYTDYLNPEQ